jgi:hypothetical protein
MKKTILFTLFFLSQVSQSYANEPEWLEKKIREGNWNINGSGSLEYDSYSGLTGFASTSVQYFVWEKFSLGVMASYQHERNGDWFSLGPKGTYYFYETEKKAFFISQAINFTWFQSDSVNSYATNNFQLISAQSSLGFEHFFNPNVSFGPELRYLYYIDNEGLSGMKNDLSILLNFNLFF